MKSSRKVIWNEGMFMIPQHFQQTDHYNESILNFRIQSLNQQYWGLLGMEIDKDALANDRFALISSSGVMPDGLVFDMPETDNLPESRNIKDFFLPSIESMDVYLTIAVERQGRINYDLDGKQSSSGQARYRREFVNVSDETTGGNEKQIGIARKQFRIMFSSESLDELSVIKIAELVRSSSGEVAIREDFVPACLRIGASDVLVRIVRQLLEMLAAKSRSLSDERRRQRSGAVEFGTSDVSNFWFLHTVNSFIPLISHYHRTASVHPEGLFLALSQLAGQLITFSPEGHPGELPPYQHGNLGQTFVSLLERLRGALEIVLSSKSVSIPLERTEQSLFVARIADERLLENAQFYLAVSAGISEADIISRVPYQIKIGSLDKINILVSAGMPGLGLYHTPRPPEDIRMQMGYHYFRIETQGDYWEVIRQAKNLAVYVPSDFTEVKLELIAIKE